MHTNQMSINLCASSSLDLLADQLIGDLKRELNEQKIGVFDKQWIVTQTEGINFWMKNQIAEKTGIAANLEFTKMNDIVQMLYHWVCADALRMMDKDRMTWALYTELEEDAFKNKYPHIAGYYINCTLRRVSLATEMADLYDQYQIYRHKEIAAWNKNDDVLDESLDWQKYLWKKMKSRLGGGYADRLEVSVNLLKELEKPENKDIIRKKLPCLRFFGLAIVTPYFLELFRVLSEIIDIKFYLLNPCPDLIWMYDVSEKKMAELRSKQFNLTYRLVGNELLLNWGTVMKESYRLMLSDDFYINVYDAPDESRYSRESNSLLERIRQEIRQNIPNEQRSGVTDEMLEDGSVRINGCYTPAREVEVLYNYLIECFDHDKDLCARDIVVMVNNMDKYAPFIRAVFDHAPKQIPYSIADESVTKGNTLFTAIRDILSVNPDTFKSEEVLSLLDSPYIRRRFGIKDISAVRQAVREAGIANGMGNANTNNPDYENTEAWLVSWEYGLQRIIYGLCMSGESEFEGGSRTLNPLDTAEGVGMADRIRLFHFVEVLKSLLQERSVPKSLKQWSAYLGDIVTKMILEEDEDDEDFPRFARLRDMIGQLEDVAGDTVIDFTTFRQVFFGRLEQEKRSSRYADKGINFCGMLPMRSVPYKIVAMLGLDFDSFPRQDSALSFSLMGKEKRLGDRSIRENDKHLFLESIMAAQQKLYISYLARNVQKGGEQPPSTLVDELMDYITLKTDSPTEQKKKMVCLHPMHVFSSRYCNPEFALPPNYIGNSLLQGKSFETDPSRQDTQPDFSVINLHDFAEFFKHPVKFYFNKHLGIYYRENDERIPETEWFELKGIQDWVVKDRLLKNKEDIDVFIQKFKRSGALPLANVGSALVKLMEGEVIAFKEVINELTENREIGEVNVYYTHGENKVTGRIKVYGDNYLYYAFSQSILYHIMYPWISYLVAIAQEPSTKLNLAMVFNVKENNEVRPQILFVKYSEELRDYARAMLPLYIKNFTAGNLSPFLFYAPMANLCYKYNPPAFQVEDLLDTTNTEQGEGQRNSYFDQDDYLARLAECRQEDFDLFSDANIEALSDNTRMMMDKLQELFPAVFAEKK